MVKVTIGNPFKKKKKLPYRKPIRGIERCIKRCGRFSKCEDRMCDECFLQAQD